MMKFIRKFIRLVAVASIVLGTYSNAAVYADDPLTATNTLETGGVSLEIHVYDMLTDKEVVEDDYNKVLPGAQIQRRAVITNTGNDAWIRVNMYFDTNDGLRDFLNESVITLVQPDEKSWVKAGDYYYLNKPLKAGESITFYKEVMVPTDWKNEDTGKVFKIHWDADAIQEKNFEPDFKSADPWYGAVIESDFIKGAATRSDDSKKFQIIFKGGAEGLVSVDKDFFANWPFMMPGDVYSDTLSIKNGYKYPVRIYFSTENAMDDALLKKLKLHITMGDKDIFYGTLAESMKEIKLAELQPKKDDEIVLKFTVEFPADATNEYALKSAQTRWVFRADVVYPAANTGITGPIAYALIGVAAIALLVIVVLTNKKKGGKNDQEH